MRNPDRPTLGRRVGEAAAALGVPLMPWQQHVADVALEYDLDTGRLAYREVNVSVPRQCGKTTLSLALMVHRSTRFGAPQSSVYLAQSRKAAVAKWRDHHVPLLEGSPFADLFTVRRQNGAEAVAWSNGSLYGLDAPTETSGHGLVLDLALVDEAWAFEDDRQEHALAPAMLTRPSAQLWVMSTAGNTRSRWWWSKVEAGRAQSPTDRSTAYFEWSAPDDADPSDPAVWRATVPSLGHTVDEAALQAEYDRAVRGGSVDLFRRAYLNQWVDPPVAERHSAVMPVEWWDRCHDAGSTIVGDVVFAVDLTPDRSTFAVAAAGVSSSGGVHVEVVEHRSDVGAEWLLRRLVDLTARNRYRSVVVHLGGPVGSLEPVLRARFGDRLHPVSDRELLAASGAMYDAIRDRTVHHVGEPSVRAALEGAAKSYSGDMWRWSRRGSHVDISPLVAVTLAQFVAAQPAPPPQALGLSAWV